MKKRLLILWVTIMAVKAVAQSTVLLGYTEAMSMEIFCPLGDTNFISFAIPGYASLAKTDTTKIIAAEQPFATTGNYAVEITRVGGVASDTFSFWIYPVGMDKALQSNAKITPGARVTVGAKKDILANPIDRPTILNDPKIFGLSGLLPVGHAGLTVFFANLRTGTNPRFKVRLYWVR